MKTNIVLIGMTGSGKTTIGKELSRELGRPFIDIDHYIEERNGKSIPELFQVSEQYFREKETEACKEIAQEASYAVISCGGGVILNKKNIDALKQTGWIVFIDRPVNRIAKTINTEHRPLLKDGTDKLYQLAEERMHLYREAAEWTVQNTHSLPEAVVAIQKHLPSTIR